MTNLGKIAEIMGQNIKKKIQIREREQLIMLPRLFENIK